MGTGTVLETGIAFNMKNISFVCHGRKVDS